MVVINLHSQHWVAESGSACKFKASLVQTQFENSQGYIESLQIKTKRCLLSLHQNINVLYYLTLKSLYNSSISNRHSFLCINNQNHSYKSQILNKKMFYASSPHSRNSPSIMLYKYCFHRYQNKLVMKIKQVRTFWNMLSYKLRIIFQNIQAYVNLSA